MAGTNPRERDVRVAKLMTNCQGLVRSIAWKIHQKLPSHVDLDDLIGFGQVGLAEAARDFDEGRGVNFTTYSYYRIRGSILDGLNKMTWFSNADYNRGKYEHIANDVLAVDQKEENSFSSDLSWFSSTTSALTSVYLISQLGSGEGSGPEKIDEDSETERQRVENADLIKRMKNLMDELPEQQQSILQGVYFEGLSIKAAGERVGISKAWASRVHKQALEQLVRQLSTAVN